MKYSIRYKTVRAMRKLGLGFDPSKSEEIKNMREVMASLSGGGIQFTVSREANGEWMAESVNIDGILTGGDAKDDVDEMIKDAIFTYFGIPPQFCDDSLLREASEPVVIKQEVFAMG